MVIVDRVWKWPYEVKGIALKSDKLTVFLRPESKLIHSTIVNGENGFLEKLWFVLRR